MKPYSDGKGYDRNCMCYSCRKGRSKGVNKALAMLMKKNARRVGKKEIQDQLED